MDEPALAADGVRFRPSKVRGVPDVDEVVVFPDRLEVRSAGAWRIFRFEDFSIRREPSWVGCLKRRLGIRAYRTLVAHLVYVREPYEDSCFEFLTEPRLTVYMPAGGPALSPHSHFWRVQEVLRRGGFAADDPDYAAERERRGLQRRHPMLRWAGQILIGVAAINWLLLFASVWWLGGSARFGEVKDGRHDVGSHGVKTEVSPEEWRFSLAIERVARPSPFLFFAGVVMLRGFPWEWPGRRDGGGHRFVAYGKPK